MSKKPPKGFSFALKKAQKLVLDPNNTADLLNAAINKAQINEKKIIKIKENLENLFHMVSAWAKGDYKKIPLQTIVFAVAAIIYFLNPFDFVIDFLPVVGYLDDAVVISFVIHAIRKELNEFLAWEEQS